MMMLHRAALAFLLTASCAYVAAGQATTAPSPAPVSRFVSAAAGIGITPPAGMRTLRGSLGNAEVVRFINEDRKWVIKVSRIILEDGKPLPLTTWKDASGHEHPGMIQHITEQFKTETPGAVVLREPEVATIHGGATQVGLMAARYNVGMDVNVLQQALVRATDLQYYLLSMTSPAPREGAIEEDAGVKLAVDAFERMLDGIELIDQTKITEDRDDRLFRTRALFVNMTPARLRNALQREQWLRYIRDGRDIGYSYVVEEIAHDIPRQGRPPVTTGPEGVLIGVRTRMHPQGGMQSDGESWLFSTFDRRFESFSNISYTKDNADRGVTIGEIGVSRKRDKPVPDAGADIGQRRGVNLTEEYRLEVTKLSTLHGSEPVVRDLPPYYIPSAIGQLLPRLVSLREPKSYLFASWVSDVGEIMYRYVDVGAEQEVTLGGKRYRAVPIKDRIGLEGAITTHYVGPDGKYIGSRSEEQNITILTSDAETLNRIWKDANLSRPGNVDGK